MSLPQDPSADDDATRRALMRLSQGDRTALDALLERHVPALQVFVRLRAGALLRQRESCADLVQSVCRELLLNLDDFEYRGEEQFRHWLFAAALNKIRQHRRYHAADRRAVAREVADGDERIEQVYSRVLTPSQHAMQRETVARLEAAFDALPTDYREVILLCRIVRLPQDEVAGQMGRTVDSVRNLLHRALARLAALVDTNEHGVSSGLTAP